METLWQALYDRLTPVVDLWRRRPSDEYKGDPEGTPYVVGTLVLSDVGDGFTKVATLTLDGYAYGGEAAMKALAEMLTDADEHLLTWRMQDTATGGATSDWACETSSPIETDDLAEHRIRCVYTARYVSDRLCSAYNDPTIS